MIKGQVIGGELGKVVIRQKSDVSIEMGELMISSSGATKILLQAYDLVYGSQISQSNLELISGMQLEEGTNIEFLDPKLRNYKLALAKPIAMMNMGAVQLCKSLPAFFSEVREVTKEDLDFIITPKNPLYFGKLRSGSKMLDLDISLPGKDVLSHHILIASTTGRGKSNLVKVMLWGVAKEDYCGVLVLDPHDEYYGRNGVGLRQRGALYYTPKNPPAGAMSLKINLRKIRPSHFNGAVKFSDAQKEAMNAYYKQYGSRWIENVILQNESRHNFSEATLGVLKRRLCSLLDIDASSGSLKCRGVFDTVAGDTTVGDIVSELENGKMVVVDTSGFSGSVEILIGSMITTEVFRRYQRYKLEGVLDSKPVISVVLEEAPRVLGKEVLESGPNIFGTLAREGRKFKVGLLAITQLPSLIPREVLANMNTKVILGIEMKPERQAIIESAAQDLSQDDRNIASLDKGEAIVTSNFARFAMPIKAPLFDEYVNQSLAAASEKKETINNEMSFEGVILD